jgi:RNA polymerase sigma-70 factor (ECF subfamily)
MSTAESTSISLLRRLKSPQADMAWQRFVDLYGPLIFYWGRQRGLGPTDAADLLQDVLSDLVVRLRDFEYDANQRFRGWLRTIVVNRASNMRRRNELAPQTSQHTSLLLVVDEKEGEGDLLAETQYRCHIAMQTLKLLKADFKDSTWQAGWMQIVEKRPAADVASELGLSVNAAYLAKSRLLARLRHELQGLVEWE